MDEDDVEASTEGTVVSVEVAVSPTTGRIPTVLWQVLQLWVGKAQSKKVSESIID